MSNNVDGFVAIVGITIGSVALLAAIALIPLQQRALRRRKEANHSANNHSYASRYTPQAENKVADPQIWTADVKADPRRRVGVIAGDMKLVRTVDVWVNSENTDMQMPRINEGSTSAMIRLLGAEKDEAGRVTSDIILNDLGRVVGDKAPVAPGSAFSTTSGALKNSHNVSYLIHVAAVQGEPGAGYLQIQDVGRCVINALTLGDRLASEGKPAASILFPILGVGVGRGPLEVTVHALISSAVAYLETMPQTTFTDVFYLGYSEHERDALLAAIDGNDKLSQRHRSDLPMAS